MKKVIFMGTPEFSVPVLKMLIENYEVVLIVTQPDKKVGRKQEIVFNPVKKVALENNIEIFQPEKIRKDYQTIIETEADIIITCAFGQIIPKIILDHPKYGCINVHASLLPEYRGGAPIHKAIIDGQNKTGITIMFMDVGMDTGDIITQEECLIEVDDNVGTMHDKLSIIGADILKKTLPLIINGNIKRIKQDEDKVTFAYNIKREDERLDFNKSGIDLVNQVRGLNPWPLAHFLFENQEYKVYEASFIKKDIKDIGIIIDINKEGLQISCNDGILDIKEIKPFGKRKMKVNEWMNGINKNKLIGTKVN